MAAARFVATEIMKIALIGPAYPYRGGIAHHTNMLYTYLRRHGHQVDLITFSRQYPKFLYPGGEQEEGGDGGEFARTIVSERLIDSMNPVSWIRTGRLLRKRGYDLYIFRYWIPLFGFVFGTIARMAHRPGRKDVMIVLDNLIPHERRPGDRVQTRFLFRYCSMAITQSTTVSRQLADMFPDIPQVMLHHPLYENFGEGIPRDQARERHGVPSGRVILFFGFVRRYKGLDRLIQAMPEIVRRLPDVHLLVVGEFFEPIETYREQIRTLGMEERISVHDRYVPNEEVGEWFSAADLLVLPYRSATNSGIVQIAYNFATPVVVTRVGSLAEVVIDGVTGIVVDDGEPTTLADAVERAFSGDTLERFSEQIVAERTKYSWDTFVEGLLRHVENVRAGAGGEAR